MYVIFDANEKSHLIHLLNNDLAGFIAIHTFEFTTIAVDGSIVI